MYKVWNSIFMMTCLSMMMYGQNTVVKVNPKAFLEDGVNVIVNTVGCTLSNNTTTTCYEIITKAIPSDHAQGPWCPSTISDDASKGGIWLDGGKVHDVDGEFIKNLATFYNNSTWKMYNSTTGAITKTATKTDCANAANPNVGTAYKNYCVECLPSYVSTLSTTFLIPVTPVKLTSAIQFANGPGGGTSPSVRGLAFNGVRFDAPAPANAILSAFTIAPFDDAGGHINLIAGYHYHAAMGKSKEISQCDVHAPMIGYALDGHPIFGRLDPNGAEPMGLDACRGHYDDKRGYHYHVDNAGNNNFINCLFGAYVKSSSGAVTIDADGDGYKLDVDCNDNNAAINPGMVEIDGNNVDENCDGLLCSVSSSKDLDFVDFNIVPNPATDNITVSFSDNFVDQVKVKLIDISGQIIKDVLVENSTLNFDVQHVNNGIYFINATSSQGSITKKVVVFK